MGNGELGVGASGAGGERGAGEAGEARERKQLFVLLSRSERET